MELPAALYTDGAPLQPAREEVGVVVGMYDQFPALRACVSL